MLITALNKISNLLKSLFVAASLTLLAATPLAAHAHGSGGLEPEETEILFRAIVENMQAVEREVLPVFTELEIKYRNHEIPVTDDQMTIRFLEKRIDLNSSAFSRLYDSSLDLARARFAERNPGEYFEPRVFDFPAFHVKARRAIWGYFVHYARIIAGAVAHPVTTAKASFTGSVGMAAAGVRLFAIHGPIYLVYTGITEALESAVMGPAHWACTFFQVAYFPLAFVGHHLWAPLVSRGHGVPLLKRLGISMQTLYKLMRLKFDLRWIFVASATGTADSPLGHKDYKKFIAGADHHFEAEMADKKFWPEHYRNFHAPHTRPPAQVAGLMSNDLHSDFEKIFATDTYSEEERFYVAVKQADGLHKLHGMLVELTDDRYKRGEYSMGTYLSVAHLLGKVGDHLTRYQDLLMTGALSPRGDAEVPAHQLPMAARALDSIQTFFKDSLELLSPQTQSYSQFRERVRNVKANLVDEATVLEKGVRSKTLVGASRSAKCKSLMNLVRFSPFF